MSTLNIIKNKIENLNRIIKVEDDNKRLAQINELISFDPKFWVTPNYDLLKERANIEKTLNELNDINQEYNMLSEYLNEFPEELEKYSKDLDTLLNKVNIINKQQMFKGPLDNCPAVLTISAGSGGLEAANWALMLLRMYSRFIDANGFKAEMLDYAASEEHSSMCIDSVSLRISGEYAYGMFKNETGVHRLIRNSPFSSSDARHTSFAAISVSPDIEDKIDIKIEDKDIEVTAQTSGAKGGQNSNKVASAIRIKHLPTGISVLARTERDQLANKKNAFKILKSKLYDIELKKKKELQDNKIMAQSDISFGHQIRTYTLTPFQLVKDHRSHYEENDASSVLDGNIYNFLISNL